MTPRPARNEKPSAPPRAGGQAALTPRAGARPVAASPSKSAAAHPSPWDVFLASRAEAMLRARSRKRRRTAMLIIVLALVLAFGPVYEYASAQYPPERISALIGDAALRLKAIPRNVLRFFSSAGGDRFESVAEELPPLASAHDANPTFGVASLKSSAAILANADTGSVLLKKNADIRVYPASLTKIMTALLVIERRAELPERIAIDPALLQPLYEADSTMAGFLPGEEVETTDLIYGALLLSGGECSAALARALAGSEEDFAAMMNARARELGMLDTHFTNATGLHDPEHYSTVRDLAKLLLCALQNEVFAEAFTTEEYTTAPTNLRAEGMTLTSNLFARIRTASFAGGRILGGKTGWTGEAGQCLASLAEKNGNRYIFVSTGNGVEADGSAYNFEDALNAYENGILPAE
ncbi:MAG: serine hydrolase [Clostridiales Family XIII bacterium]|jgi:D-alanyl-D-alanine carboxypeptidase (penicillin-binding protein 5/6)|nr:serine hydrolase [Clostridiales Family XIII bacterium]